MITRRKVLFQLAALFAGSAVYLNCSQRAIRESKSRIYYRSLIIEIAEIIIPNTDSPGAKQADLYKCIIGMINQCLPSRDRRTIFAGLDDVEQYTKKKYSLSFIECNDYNKILVLERFQNLGRFDNKFLNKVKTKLLGPSFFELIKELTTKAYCTSQIGATQGLSYEHVPVSYIACMPLLSNQRSWATA